MKEKKMVRVKNLQIAIITMAIIVLGGCASTKKVAYFKNWDDVDLSASRMLYDARIMPKDLLSITVTSTNATASAPFNLTVNTAITASTNLTIGTQREVLQSYLVDNDGNVEFPQIGTIHLGGLTKSEAELYIKNKIMPYMSVTDPPIVTVRMINYKFAVIGEVGRPGVYTVTNEKTSILEALAQAGDLTIYGVRDKVKLIREDARGEKSIHNLNLNDAEIINSPYYYLQQNDIVYVEPNNVKAQNSNVGSLTTLIFSATSVLISLTSLLFNILN